MLNNEAGLSFVFFLFANRCRETKFYLRSSRDYIIYCCTDGYTWDEYAYTGEIARMRLLWHMYTKAEYNQFPRLNWQVKATS